MRYESFLSLLSDVRAVPTVQGMAQAHRARCPAHQSADGRHGRTLSLAETRDGHILLHCHAGCGAEEITAAIGLAPSALFSDNNGGGLGLRGGISAWVSAAAAAEAVMDSAARLAAASERAEKLEALGQIQKDVQMFKAAARRAMRKDNDAGNSKVRAV